MAEPAFTIKVELDDFIRGAKKISNKYWPDAIVNGLSNIANDADEAVTRLTKQKFTLRNRFVTQGIKHYPDTASQKSIAKNAVRKYGDLKGAVYLRGAREPKRSLEFMAHHEEGYKRTPQDKWIAMPLKHLKQKGFKTKSGQVRKRWQPSVLLKRFKETGGKFTGTTTRHSGYTQRKKRLPGNAFIINTAKGPMIARRIIKPARKKQDQLEFLYVFKNKAAIQERWGFADKVYQSVRATYDYHFTKQIANIPDMK